MIKKDIILLNLNKHMILTYKKNTILTLKYIVAYL